MTYLANCWLWLRGFARLREVALKPRWRTYAPPRSFALLYLLDYGINVVFLAGQVETISRHAQDHRSGWVWDKLLDILERFDEGHGPRSGPPLWDSRLPPKWQRITVPLAWVALAWLAA